MKARTVKAMCSDGRVRTATFREYGPIDRVFVRTTVNGIQRTVTGRVVATFDGSIPAFVPDVGLVNEKAIPLDPWRAIRYE